MNIQQTHTTTDVVIIGAGPVGLFAVFQCGMLKMRCHVVDSLPEVGGQCSALYPEKPIYDIPAYPAILGAELIQQLRQQAEPFDPVYHLEQQVMQVERHGSRWRVVTSAGTVIDAAVIMIAGGCGAFGPNRPPLEGLEAFEGTSVFYHVARKEQFRGKRIVIAGGGDSAVDWANALADVAAKIYVVHRRPKFRAAPQSVSQMQQRAQQGDVVEMVIPYQLHGVQGSHGNLEVVEVATLEGEVRRLEADILLPFFGLAMELGPIATWGLHLDMQHITVHQATMQTNQAGIFAIGDIATYEGKLKLILCGFSEAAMAAHAAYALVHPETALHFEYSTSKGVPH